MWTREDGIHFETFAKLDMENMRQRGIRDLMKPEVACVDATWMVDCRAVIRDSRTYVDLNDLKAPGYSAILGARKT